MFVVRLISCLRREASGTFRKYLILGWGGGMVSDPQNCKIQKVPGYFLKTKLGIFLTFLATFQ